MKPMTQMVLVLLLTLSLAGCGGGTDDTAANTPTDPSLEFTTFPATFFSGSYSASYSLTGSVSSGSSNVGITATWDIQSSSNNVFNQQSVNAILHTINVTYASGQIENLSGEDYYTADIIDLRVLGSYDFTSGVISTATATSHIPLTAKIGDSGSIGTYSQTDGNTSTLTWALKDGFNGKAKLSITYSERNGGNTLMHEETQSWIIEQNGRRTGVEVTRTSFALNATLTMTGTLN